MQPHWSGIQQQQKQAEPERQLLLTAQQQQACSTSDGITVAVRGQPMGDAGVHNESKQLQQIQTMSCLDTLFGKPQRNSISGQQTDRLACARTSCYSINVSCSMPVVAEHGSMR